MACRGNFENCLGAGVALQLGRASYQVGSVLQMFFNILSLTTGISSTHASLDSLKRKSTRKPRKPPYLMGRTMENFMVSGEDFPVKANTYIGCKLPVTSATPKSPPPETPKRLKAQKSEGQHQRLHSSHQALHHQTQILADLGVANSMGT